MSDNYDEKINALDTLSDAIDLALEIANISRATLYKESRIDQSNFAKIINCERNLKLDQIIRLTSVLKNSVLLDFIAKKANIFNSVNNIDTAKELQKINNRLDDHDKARQEIKNILHHLIDKI